MLLNTPRLFTPSALPRSGLRGCGRLSPTTSGATLPTAALVRRRSACVGRPASAACRWMQLSGSSAGSRIRGTSSPVITPIQPATLPVSPLPLPPAAEGNLHGILVGRENLPDGILYASRETHYSVFKAARMYRMDAVKVRPGSRQRFCFRLGCCCWGAAGWRCLWGTPRSIGLRQAGAACGSSSHCLTSLPLPAPTQVGTLESGEIDYDELRSELAANAARPAIINVNIGTTVKGAVDDLDRVLDILKARGAGGCCC